MRCPPSERPSQISSRLKLDSISVLALVRARPPAERHRRARATGVTPAASERSLAVEERGTEFGTDGAAAKEEYYKRIK